MVTSQPHSHIINQHRHVIAVTPKLAHKNLNACFGEQDRRTIISRTLKDGRNLVNERISKCLFAQRYNDIFRHMIPARETGMTGFHNNRQELTRVGPL